MFAGLALLVTTPFGALLAALWGALWGSFFNVAVHRLGREDASLRMLLRPPSHCPHCLHRIRARDNVPVLGWLLLRGRCRDCRARISPRYPLVELASAGLAVAVYCLLAPGLADAPALLVARFLAVFFFAGTLLVLALIDLDTRLLPDAITVPGIPFFFLIGQAAGVTPLTDALIGLVVGYGALKALQVGYAAATGRDGLGGGDPMLLALIGGFLGWRALPLTLGGGASLGTLVMLPLLLVARARSRDAVSSRRAPAASGDDEPDLRHVEVPFGPFLVAGALLYLFFGQALWAWLLAFADRA